jgi:TPR repeat protein
MKTNTIVLILSVVTSMQSIAIAQELKTPIDKNVNSNQPEMDNILSGAYGGEGAEQYNLGYHYLYGQGVNQSNKEAKKWFDLAAKSDSPAARYKIGRLYETGVLYQKDIDKAVFHYEFAAKNGDLYAINNLAILYLNGTGVSQDVNKGIKFLTQAAERANVEAQVNLGLYYLNAIKAEHSIKSALKWFTEAAKENNPTALYYLAEHAFAEKDYVKAYDYYLTSAQQSNNNAQLKLAMLYAKGLGIEKNNSTATNWLTKAAKLGNKKAISMLKQMGKY